MKRVLLFLLIILPFYLLASFYFLDKSYFLCPIGYQRGIIIRNDSRGEGLFGAERRGARQHKGLDLFAAVGTSVLAARSGLVIAARQNQGMGKYVIIRHSGKLITIYGHLSRIYVIKGEFIRQGTLIGEVGKTGNARSPEIKPHLHFEVRKKGIPQDPLEYLE